MEVCYMSTFPEEDVSGLSEVGSRQYNIIANTITTV